jgi:hypothetical protein
VFVACGILHARLVPQEQSTAERLDTGATVPNTMTPDLTQRLSGDAMRARSCWRRNSAFCAMLLVAAGLTHATVVPDLYEATVAVDRGQGAAFQDAMRQVIVRVTGQRDGDSVAALSDLISGAQRYVQKYRNLPGGKVTIGFDGSKLESVIAAAGRPVWGRERPVTLIWLAVDDGAGRRRLIGANDEGDVKTEVDAVANSRGLPVLWPRLDSVDTTRVSADDVWKASLDKLTQAAARYRADTVLVGKLSAGYGEWTLIGAGETRQIRGGVTDGVHGLADRLAELLAASSGEPVQPASLDVAGVDSLAAFADVIASLEASSLIRNVSVGELAGDRVVLSLSVRGTPDRLRRALATQRKFQPLEESTANPSKLFFRYRP